LDHNRGGVRKEKEKEATNLLFFSWFSLRIHFEAQTITPRSIVLAKKKDPKSGDVMSMGYGFVEFASKEVRREHKRERERARARERGRGRGSEREREREKEREREGARERREEKPG
jgi:hypothetical protein